MKSPQNIIALAHQIIHEHGDASMDEMLRIAQALLNRDEQLKIAVEALKGFSAEQRTEVVGHVNKILPSRTACKAMKALARIHSITLP